MTKLKNYAFIDGQNLHVSIENQGWHLDYLKFRKYLKDKFNIDKAFYFIGFVDTNNDLYESLQNFGYILIFKPTLIVDGKRKGNVDAELVLHAMIEYNNYEKAVIVSGDGDFYCLAKHLKQKGKLEKIIVPNDLSYSRLLSKFASEGYMFGLNKLKDKLGIKKEA